MGRGGGGRMGANGRKIWWRIEEFWQVQKMDHFFRFFPKFAANFADHHPSQPPLSISAILASPSPITSSQSAHHYPEPWKADQNSAPRHHGEPKLIKTTNHPSHLPYHLLHPPNLWNRMIDSRGCLTINVDWGHSRLGRQMNQSPRLTHPTMPLTPSPWVGSFKLPSWYCQNRYVSIDRGDIWQFFGSDEIDRNKVNMDQIDPLCRKSPYNPLQSQRLIHITFPMMIWDSSKLCELYPFWIGSEKWVSYPSTFLPFKALPHRPPTTPF